MLLKSTSCHKKVILLKIPAPASLLITQPPHNPNSWENSSQFHLYFTNSTGFQWLVPKTDAALTMNTGSVAFMNYSSPPPSSLSIPKMNLFFQQGCTEHFLVLLICTRRQFKSCGSQIKGFASVFYKQSVFNKWWIHCSSFITCPQIFSMKNFPKRKGGFTGQNSN